ncbi:MAG: SpoIIE family protein phosphatase [Desulfobacterales bacterium]
MGLKKDVVYEEHCFTNVKEGQIYMALTDGLPETFNKSGEMFGMQRVQNLIREYAHFSTAEICRQINTEVSRFRDGASPQDDLTFVLIKVL